MISWPSSDGPKTRDTPTRIHRSDGEEFIVMLGPAGAASGLFATRRVPTVSDIGIIDDVTAQPGSAGMMGPWLLGRPEHCFRVSLRWRATRPTSRGSRLSWARCRWTAIVTFGMPPTVERKQATPMIPIVTIGRSAHRKEPGL